MPESIFIQVGQCGNQVGNRFWEMALHEHARHTGDKASATARMDGLATLFRPADASTDGELRARAVLVDMEEAVVNDVTRRHRHSSLFAPEQRVTGVSGSGNNFAHGHYGHLRDHYDDIAAAIRAQVELCDSLQSFHLCHSMGGGTGSGVGTGILRMLEEQGWCDRGAVSRFCSVVYPAAQADDVVTSPYNSVLAMNELTEWADCVLPVENQALVDMVQRSSPARSVASRPYQHAGDATIKPGSSVAEGPSSAKRSNAFDKMNNIVAQSLLHLTSSMRFEGSMNVDINEISVNLVPFPRLKYVLSSLAPLNAAADVGASVRSATSSGARTSSKAGYSTSGASSLKQRNIDAAFEAVVKQETQLTGVDPRSGVYVACALLARGSSIGIADVRRNIDRLQRTLKFVPWNRDGWKTGLCAVPPLYQSFSVMALANHTGIRRPFQRLRDRYVKLYRRRAHVHHYTDYMDIEAFDTALVSIDNVLHDYAALENTCAPHSSSLPATDDSIRMLDYIKALSI